LDEQLRIQTPYPLKAGGRTDEDNASELPPAFASARPSRVASQAVNEACEGGESSYPWPVLLPKMRARQGELAKG